MADRFQFFNTSKDSLPGKGVGESITSGESYLELSKIPNWRRILSNQGETPFSWEEVQWKTLEEAMLAAQNPMTSEKKNTLTKSQKAEWESRKEQVLEELLNEKFRQSKDAQKVLLLTGTAELWHLNRKLRLSSQNQSTDGKEIKASKEEHWTYLETLRQTIREELEKKEAEKTPIQRIAPTPQTDRGAMSEKPTKTKAAPKSKAKKEVDQVAQSEGNIGYAPSSTNAEEPPVNFTRLLGHDQGEKEKEKENESSIHFCPICKYYLYLQADTPNDPLIRLCRNCGFREKDEKGGLVMEMMVQERSAEGYKILLNEFTRKDPRLPHIHGSIQCPEAGCPSNSSGQESDIIYIKYDHVNLLYIYICDICGFQWRSRR